MLIVYPVNCEKENHRNTVQIIIQIEKIGIIPYSYSTDNHNLSYHNLSYNIHPNIQCRKQKTEKLTTEQLFI